MVAAPAHYKMPSSILMQTPFTEPLMIRSVLGAGLLLAIASSVALAADPTPDDAIALIDKLKGKKKKTDRYVQVDLGRKKVTDDDLKVIAVLTTIRSLNVSAEFTKDKKGKISSKSAITDAGLKNIAGMTQLDKLELEGANITNAGLQHLAKMKNLTSLVLSGTKVTDEGMEELKKLDKLQRLQLYDTQVTDTGVSTLKRWKIDLNILR
jgi:internalin A